VAWRRRRAAGEAKDASALSHLAEAEWEAVLALGEGPSSFLTPIFLLHFDPIGEYRAEGRASLAEHSIRMSQKTALAMARGSAAKPSPAIAALLLLASDLLDRGRLAESEDLLLRALALDETSIDTLLLLAIDLELQGRYKEASGYLQNLLAAEPGHYEARLRLGTDLRRIGKLRRSRELLRQLGSDSPPEWIGVVAAQEATRPLIDERAEETIPELRASLEKWSRHQGLEVLLAYALELKGEHEESLDLVENLVWRSTGNSAESARLRYARRPEASLLRLENVLRDEAASAAGELSARLGNEGQDPGS